MPWIPNQVWTSILSDREWLKLQLEQALDHKRRMDRAEKRLPEVAPPAVERRDDDVPPDEFWDVLASYDSDAVRDQLHREAKSAHATGVPWKRIIETMKRGVE